MTYCGSPERVPTILTLLVESPGPTPAASEGGVLLVFFLRYPLLEWSSESRMEMYL